MTLKISNPESLEWFEQRAELLTKFEKLFHETLLVVVKEKREMIIQRLNRDIQKYEELRKMDRPYFERAHIGEKIEELHKMLERNQRMFEEIKKFSFPTLFELLEWGDYDRIENLGFKKFIETYIL